MESSPIISIPIGCDVCVDIGDNVTIATLLCFPLTKRLPVDCVINNPEGLTANQLASYDGFHVSMDYGLITMMGLLANPEDPAPPRILGDWTCMCNNSDGRVIVVSKFGSCRKLIKHTVNIYITK